MKTLNFTCGVENHRGKLRSVELNLTAKSPFLWRGRKEVEFNAMQLSAVSTSRLSSCRMVFYLIFYIISIFLESFACNENRTHVYLICS